MDVKVMLEEEKKVVEEMLETLKKLDIYKQYEVLGYAKAKERE